MKGLLLELDALISQAQQCTTQKNNHHQHREKNRNNNNNNNEIVLGFKAQHINYIERSFQTNIDKIKKQLLELLSRCVLSQQNMMLLSEIFALLNKQFDAGNLRKLKVLIKKLEFQEQSAKNLKFSLPKNIPLEINQEVQSDLGEIEKCYTAGCYKAVAILCGRILETMLHRKYFEVTGFDILEKNPGIGLGTLIAKLEEKQIELDPAIKQQIHLINQVRIFSVHKKKTLFQPTQQQAHALILYTLDIVRKLF